MMLVGQCEKGYLVFDPVNTKVHLSRNVKILENVNFYDQKLSSSKNTKIESKKQILVLQIKQKK